MKHIVCFSGGKDSTALVLWAKENLAEFTTVFCDTGWEHPITYAYVEEINQTQLGGKLVTLKSEKYDGFVQLCVDRNRIPSVRGRFCTDELKVFPLHKYYESLDDEITAYQGIRSDESAKRATYEMTQWVNEGGGYWVQRPLLHCSVDDVFAIHRRHGVKPNPLYLMNHSRVGCWPCVMMSLRELKRILCPELKTRLRELERFVNENVSNKETRKWLATFFAAGTIPDRFCSLKQLVDCRKCDATGELSGAQCPRCKGQKEYMAYVPTVDDVFRYLDSVDEDQLPLLPARSCMSVYNLCE